MVSSEGSHGHCRSWCTQQEWAKLLFLRKTEGLHPGNRTDMSNIKVICSMNRWYMQWHTCVRGHPKNFNFVQRVPNKILESWFQPLEFISLHLFTKWFCVTFFDVMPNWLLVTFYSHNIMVLGKSTQFKTLKICPLISKS